MASKRNSSGAASAPLSHYNDQGVRERWPVLVYRLQSHRGWEVYADPDKEATTSTSSTSLSGKKTNAAANKPTRGSNNSGATNNTSGGNNVSSSRDPRPIEDLTVAPREGCIEVRKMRLRIQLFEQHTPWDPNQPYHHHRRRAQHRDKENQQPNNAANAQGKEHEPEGTDKNNADINNDKNNDDAEEQHYDSDTPGADGWNDNSLLVRRRNTLLVTTRRGMGAVVFRFKSTQDCIDFCDRLTYLNREHLAPMASTRDDDADLEDATCKKRVRSTTVGQGDGYVNGMDRRELRIDEMRNDKRRKCTDKGTLSTKLLRRPASDVRKEEAPATSQELRCYARQEEIMSYIVRLAHNEEFRGFVDELERGLESAEDTAAIHAAFGA